MPPSDDPRLRLQRERTADTARQMMASLQISQNDAARRLGVSPATLSRMLRAAAAGVSLAPGVSSGRPSKFGLTEEETACLRGWHLRKDSLAVAIEFFAGDPKCRPETRDAIRAEQDRSLARRRAPSWPLSLRRAGHVTEEERAIFRGQKAFGNIEHLDRRGLWWVDEAGASHPLLPNTIWESDDMSSNEPFSWLDPERGGQVLVGRQTLCTTDVFSAAWLGASPLGRSRDAYRVEDQADHMWDSVQAHGLPAFWRLERGPWENNFIDGIPLVDGTRWGGLDALFGVIRTWKSRGKGGIESAFNLLQTFLAHESLSIGRVRGEFEAGTRAFLRAGAGNAAEAAKFWTVTECADAFRDAMERFNARPKTRRAFGRDQVVPDDLYAGAVRRECPADQAWRFLPVKKTATVRGGHLEISVPHYPLPFRFRCNGEKSDLYLPAGYPVLIAFHPGRPERGCHVFNAARGAANREGWPVGHPLLLAPPAADAPQFTLSRDDQAMLARKRANAAVTTEFRSIHGTDAQTKRRRVSEARDGFGRSARLETGAVPAPAAESGGNTPAASGDGTSPISRSTRPAGAGDAAANRLAERERKARETLGIF